MSNKYIIINNDWPFLLNFKSGFVKISTTFLLPSYSSINSFFNRFFYHIGFHVYNFNNINVNIFYLKNLILFINYKIIIKSIDKT